MALRDNLISWWELNETSGTRVDAHGSNDLADNNTVLYATGKQGNGADFELANSEYLSITDASQTGLDITGDFSISLWVNHESKVNSAIHAYLSKCDAAFSAGNRSFIIGLRDSEVPSAGNGWGLAFWLYNGSQTLVQTQKAWNPSTATWYHVVMTWDASASTAEWFIDGSSIGTVTTTGATDMYSSSGPFNMGSRGGANYLLDGLLDEVGIWDKVLSGAEITELYNSGSGLTYAGTAPSATFTPRVSFIM